MDVTVLCFRRDAEGLGIREVADDGMPATRRHASRFLIVAHERRHVVRAAHERVENGGADVACRASQKNSHRGRIS